MNQRENKNVQLGLSTDENVCKTYQKEMVDDTKFLFNRCNCTLPLLHLGDIKLLSKSNAPILLYLLCRTKFKANTVGYLSKSSERLALFVR